MSGTPFRRAIDRRRLREGIEIGRRVMRDREARDALATAVEGGRRVYGSVAGDRPSAGMARLARDKHLQDDAGAFLRAVSGAVDAGVRAGRRRRRRAVLAWAALIGGAGVLLARRRAGTAATHRPHEDAIPVDAGRAGVPIG